VPKVMRALSSRRSYASRRGSRKPWPFSNYPLVVLNDEPIIRYQLVIKDADVVLSRRLDESIYDSLIRQKDLLKLPQDRIGLNAITEAGLTRAVTADDFEEFAGALPQVARAEITVYDASKEEGNKEEGNG
jgi:hypothetical protein